MEDRDMRQAGPDAPPAKKAKAVTFHDGCYVSRKLKTPEGVEIKVRGGRTTATDPAAVSFLQAHPDFTEVS